jgi:hypothetical protein
VLELTLQVRSQHLTGQSAFTRLTGQSAYVVTDPATGLRLLRPHAVIRGQRSTMHANRYGLRGADFPQRGAPGEARVVLLGASTIMGTTPRLTMPPRARSLKNDWQRPVITHA